MKRKPAFKAVILAGGSGERFWPLSTAEHPKQFLNIFGGESLIRQSVSRLGDLVQPQDVVVVTSKALVSATRKELKGIKNVIGEPMRRDTGAAVALGVGVAAKGEDCVIGCFSSDQLVADTKRFRKAVEKAIAIANKRDVVVTLGIKPTYAATGFGYVDPKCGRFVEKPNADKAKQYLKQGFLWNAGMFIARASVFRRAFAEFADPAVAKLARGEFSLRALTAVYEPLPKISFDFAVMEKLSAAGGVAVVPCDCGWDDVGSYGAFDKYFPHDRDGNVREGPCTVVDSSDNICVARSARISLLGVKNLVVVTTPDSVLVVSKDCVSDMKKLFRRG